MHVAAGDAEVGFRRARVFPAVFAGGNPGRTGVQDGLQHAAPPSHEPAVVEHVFARVLDAAGEEVLVLRSGEEGYDEAPVLPLAGRDEVGEKDGGDGLERGGRAAGQIQQVQVPRGVGLCDEDGGQVEGGVDKGFEREDLHLWSSIIESDGDAQEVAFAVCFLGFLARWGGVKSGAGGGRSREVVDGEAVMSW